MKKLNLRIVTISLVTIAALSFAAIAYAKGNPHFVELNCFDGGNTAVCTGKVAGLGNQTGLVTVTADALVTCINPGGHSPAPWSEQLVGYGATFSTTRNGAQSFEVTTEPVSGRGCPNVNWTLDVISISNIQATVTR